MKNRLIQFKFNENQLISALYNFAKWYDGETLTEEQKGLIASYVMEGHLSIYAVEVENGSNTQ